MTTPAPGSDAARAQGCKCPVLDNGHGRGYLGMAGVYVYSSACDLHRPDSDAVIARAGWDKDDEP